MPAGKKRSTTHHCPKKGKGEENCRYNKSVGYCTAHQTKCETHQMIHLQDENCRVCVPTRAGRPLVQRPRALSTLSNQITPGHNLIAMKNIPTIDLSKQPDPKEVSAAISDLGFLFLKNAGVPSQNLIQKMFAVSKGFFEGESAEEKEKVSITVQNQGWVRNRQESLDSKGHPLGDIKEAFNLSKFAANGQPGQPMPPTLSQHIHTISAFMGGCHELSMALLRSFAQTLELPEDHFTSRHAYDSEHSSILRLLYYPPSDIPEDQSEGEIRAGAHSDYGSLTLLFQKSLGGLQIKLPNGEWLDAPVVDDAVLVNIGDLFEFWSGGRYTSTVHRVALPRGPEAKEGRYSIAYFLHPTDDVLLARIPMQHAEEEQKARSSVKERFGIDADEQMTAREWLDRRLAATYKTRKDA